MVIRITLEVILKPPIIGMNLREIRECKKHGLVQHIFESKRNYFRCQRCRNDHVIEFRRLKKRKLVQEAGGVCVKCGYNKHVGALQFHHTNPENKSFGISEDGRSTGMKKSREEAKKCVLLCANCHQEIEDGIIQL